MYKITCFVGCCEKIIAADENLLLIHKPFFVSWAVLVWGFVYIDSDSGDSHSFCHSLIFLSVFFSSLPP